MIALAAELPGTVFTDGGMTAGPSDQSDLPHLTDLACMLVLYGVEIAPDDKALGLDLLVLLIRRVACCQIVQLGCWASWLYSRLRSFSGRQRKCLV